MLKKASTVLLAALLAAGTAAAAWAQQRTAPGPSATGKTLVPGIADSAIFADLALRSIGPAVMSGRISDIAVARDLSDGATDRLGRVMYVASAGGGVWKTTNGGVTWDPVFDHEGSASIGAVAVAPSNPDIVWVGSGEANNLRSSLYGDGVYKSTDGGQTWQHMGLPTSQHIGRIIIHPTNPDIVFVAAVGPLWTEGGERGIFRTTDGGNTWTNVKRINDTTGFTDIAFDPTNPSVLYAASYQRERKAYSFVAGGPESGIYKSTDGGDSWARLTNGLPTGDIGRIGLAVSPSNPQIVYAVLHHATEGGVYRSDDGGQSWRRTSNVSSIPWYFGQIRVDPKDPERVYFLGVSVMESSDGGKKFTTFARAVHADNHAMWIDPNDPQHMVLGNDGGLYVSEDRGATWDYVVNLPVSTFYTVAADMREPYYVYGGLQDNGTWAGPVRTRYRDGITNEDWFRAGGGDGFYAAIDPTDPDVAYAESQNGSLTRVDVRIDEHKSIRPPAQPGEELRYNWSAPLLISPHDHNTLYFGANYLFKSTDRGDSWQRLGGDLTRQLNRDKLPIMGYTGPGGLGRNEGTAPFGNISTIDESPLRAGLLYVGTDDGLVQVSRDDGQTWTKIAKFPGVPDMTYVSHVVASSHAEGTVYVTLDGHRSNDFRPYVLKSTDYGKTFTSIASNLPQRGSAYVIREALHNPEVLFVGTDFGLFISLNGGGSWTPLKNGFPTVAVKDLLIHPRDNDLIVATHGRGMYVLDDITPLERLATAMQATPVAQLFPIRPATIFTLKSNRGMPGNREYAQPNPPSGAVLTYLVKPTVPAGAKLTLAVMDGSGQLVRELEATATPGLHRTTWDLRHTSPVPAPERAGRGGRGGGGGDQGAPAFFRRRETPGPLAFAGDYRVELRLTGRGGNPQVLAQAPVTVELDPLVKLTPAEYADLNLLRMRTARLQADANQLVQQLDSAQARLADAMKGADSTAASYQQGAQVVKDIDALLNRIRGPERGGFGGRGGGGGGRGGNAGGPPAIMQRANQVAGQIGNVNFPITAEQRQTIDEASADLEKERGNVAAVLARAVDAAQAMRR